MFPIVVNFHDIINIPTKEFKRSLASKLAYEPKWVEISNSAPL